MSYQALLTRIHEIYDLRKAARVLAWDREVVMPKGGDADRVQQITTLNRLAHSLYTADEIGALIECAAVEQNGAGYESAEASLIRFLRHDYAQARKLPADFVSQFAALRSQATAIWKVAREEDSFATFEPWLAQIASLSRQMASYLGYETEPYDALLGRHEPGAQTAAVEESFSALKAELVPLYFQIRERPDAVGDDFLHQRFDIAGQEHFSRYLAAAVGYDFNRGYLATAVHPFSTSLSRNDVRITTRYYTNFLSASIFATLHEAGHAVYVQNVHPDLTRTPLAKETSAGLDESQSRLVENFIGRSRGFWRAHLPRLQALFPQQLGEVSLEAFYRAVNKVQPGLVRVEADELTYNLHVILRFEIERLLINGEFPIQELPAVWADKSQELLGIRPRSHRLGCLQDIHWAMVGFGYFPTYALGNLYAAQLVEAAFQSDVEMAAALDEGEIGPLMNWLRENVQVFGRMLTPAELIQRATGRPLDHSAFVTYLSAKLSEVYDLG
ncbi:MAG: carboxypeptidase M32 [Candidatus Promineifilaceae bacterium]